jgi:hypothetical protein
MFRQWRTLGAVVLIAALIAVNGCAVGDSPLDGTRWRLTGWTLSSLYPLDFTITAGFSEGRISGSTGVNAYGGPYTLGPGAVFSTGPLAVTLMAGSEPAMRVERAYLELLGQAKSYRLAGSRLTLYDQGGNDSLYFDAVGK